MGHLSVDPVTGGMFKRYPYYKVVMKVGKSKLYFSKKVLLLGRIRVLI